MDVIMPIAVESIIAAHRTTRKPAGDRTDATRNLSFAEAAWPVWRNAVFARQR